MTLADRIVLLKDGQVQQIGAPLELYEQPANEFVATFIGSPTMNLLDGMLKEGKVGLGPVNIPAPGVDGPVRMGIRPHDFRIVDQSQEGSFGAEVIVTEPMGHETIVYCRVGSVNLTVALEGLVGVRPGDLIHLQCAAERSISLTRQRVRDVEEVVLITLHFMVATCLVVSLLSGCKSSQNATNEPDV